MSKKYLTINLGEQSTVKIAFLFSVFFYRRAVVLLAKTKSQSFVFSLLPCHTEKKF